MFDDNLKNSPGTAPANLPLAKEPEDMFANLDNSNKPMSMPTATANSNGTSDIPNALASGKLKIKEPIASGVLGAFPNNPPTAAPQNNVSQTPPVYTMKEPVLGKIILLMFLLLLLVGLGYGGYWFYGQYFVQSVNGENNNQSAVSNENEQVPSSSQPVKTENMSTTTNTNVVNSENEQANDDTDMTTGTNVVQDASNDKVLFGEPVDSDRDGLDDIREKALGTDLNSADTDGDGVNDGDEVNIWHTDPKNPDTDGDGYPDGQEIKNGYNPRGDGKIFDTIVSNTNDNTTSNKK